MHAAFTDFEERETETNKGLGPERETERRILSSETAHVSVHALWAHSEEEKRFLPSSQTELEID